MQSRRIYAHVDMDAFYVSVELQRRPELRGLPVVVAGTGPRAVVTTASYEARRFGVFSATPAERARRLCPDAVFIPPDFEAYRARSREVMAVLRSHVERVEGVGLDEAYLDLTSLDRHRSAARRVKDAVRSETGLTCSVGLGPNKLVAKVASDAEKPDGFVELTDEEARVRFAEASPGLIPGIGPKTLGRLEDARAIETVRIAKSESRETTFDSDLHGLPQLEPVLERLTNELCETLAREERRGRTIGIKVRFDDFTTVTRARSLDSAVNDTTAVGTVALDLLRRLDPRRPVRLLGVRVAGLDEEAAKAAADDQLSLSL